MTPVKAIYILAAVAILEGVIITWLIVTESRFEVIKQASPIPAESPIALALKYDAPDKKFEEVVKQNPGWLPYRFPYQPTAILAECAYEKRTNYVRILIKNGADIGTAVKQLKEVNQMEAVDLLKQVQLELKQ